MQLISGQVKKGTRDTDLLSRYGGEEFVVILPETDAQAAFLVGEKVREQVAASPFHFKGKRVQITISCGIAALILVSGQNKFLMPRIKPCTKPKRVAVINAKLAS